MGDKSVRREKELMEDLKCLVQGKILLRENFNESFTGLAMPHRRLLKLQNIIEQAVVDSFLRELAAVFKEADIVTKFRETSKLISVPGLNWRPPGDPIIQMRSIRVEVKRKKLQEKLTFIKFKSESVRKIKNSFTNVIKTTSNLKAIDQRIQQYVINAKRELLSNNASLESVSLDLEKSIDLPPFDEVCY